MYDLHCDTQRLLHVHHVTRGQRRGCACNAIRLRGACLFRRQTSIPPSHLSTIVSLTTVSTLLYPLVEESTPSDTLQRVAHPRDIPHLQYFC
jgi:hypothetical protein